ncbi:type II toxin-antitoxin system Phd/YefM family antitoxin [Nostoc sp. UHCC 0870]|uniref:type II toxin-antitoxin system Phd/YefM family antitoxin n=1 Tax=Nostoc sp. UHCC 0870 TaxID=2914041 RepID=UPI001EDD3079|nr:hypothetical protein [Nostoc sp. UHCC 0870]UKO99832.1 hypothetical protein L6494_09060 [Nostoc sp. UHCC 0870]
MTITVNVAEANPKFTELLNQVLLCEEVLIAEQGIPVARLVTLSNNSYPLIPDLDKGKSAFLTNSRGGFTDILELFTDISLNPLLRTLD